MTTESLPLDELVNRAYALANKLTQYRRNARSGTLLVITAPEDHVEHAKKIIHQALVMAIEELDELHVEVGHLLAKELCCVAEMRFEERR